MTGLKQSTMTRQAGGLADFLIETVIRIAIGAFTIFWVTVFLIVVWFGVEYLVGVVIGLFLAWAVGSLLMFCMEGG